MFLAGGGDGDEGERSGREDVMPADLRTLRLPLLQQQQEDLVQVLPPELLEVPVRKSREIEVNVLNIQAYQSFLKDLIIRILGVERGTQNYNLVKDKLSLYHKICALLVPTEKRIRFPCNSISMPPARDMLKFRRR